MASPLAGAGRLARLGGGKMRGCHRAGVAAAV